MKRIMNKINYPIRSLIAAAKDVDAELGGPKCCLVTTSN